MRAVILGAGGQLAHDLARVMERWDLLKWRHEDLDITDQAAVRARLSQVHVEAVVNTAGFHRVEECETQHERAFAVNTYAVRHLAQICREIGAVLVHLSTDYVFGGEKHTPYLEGDLPRPLNVYGASKLAGEHLAAALCPELLVVRSSGLFGVAGSRAKGGNFVETMLRLARAGSTIRVVDDQVLAPTYAYDLACAIRDLLEGGGRRLLLRGPRQHHAAREPSRVPASGPAGSPAAGTGRWTSSTVPGSRRCSRPPARSGARTVDVLGMLLHQGALALRLWTGRRPPLETMRRALIRAAAEDRP